MFDLEGGGRQGCYLRGNAMDLNSNWRMIFITSEKYQRHSNLVQMRLFLHWHALVNPEIQIRTLL